MTSPVLPGGLLERVRGRLLAEHASGGPGGGAAVSPARVAAALRAEGSVLGDAEVLAVAATLRSELAGTGPLEPLLALPGVTDVLVNGPDAVWIDRGAGLERSAVRFRDEAAVRRLAQRLAASAGRRLDDAAPYVDARLPDGSRLHAVVPPVAVNGTVLSIRIPARRSLTLDELCGSGSMSAATADLLRKLVGARRAFLVTGGTGSGKTTLLATLLGLVEPTERVVIVEDSTELAPEHPHVVRLAARHGNVESAGQVDLATLVRQCLRMRPDRLVVGEVRGAEVVDLLAALNTGHEGGCGTVHANAPTDLPARIEALAAAAGLDRDAAHSQLAAALDVVVHVERTVTGRRVAGLWVLDRDAAGRVHAVLAHDADDRPGPGAERLAELLVQRGGLR